MQSRPKPAQYSNRHEAGRAPFTTIRLFGMAWIILLALVWPVIMAQTAAAAGRPPGGRLDDPAVRKVDIAAPAMVRIVLLFRVRITLTLCGQDITLPRSYQVGSSGSGAFISANGDILTADHVVAADGAEIIFNPQADQDIANLLDNNPSCHLRTPVSPNDIANGFLDFAGINYTTQVSSVQHMVWQGTPYSGQLDTSSSQSVLTALSNAPHLDGTVVSESALTENDMAIVHVDLTDTPSIQLDDSSQVAMDDHLTIIGYPGNGDEFRALSDQTVDANDLLTPSVNDVTVSSIKTNDNGAKLIQVSGNVEHGDSGGPALDVNGDIVGIVSFGTNAATPETVGNTSFLRSSNDAQALIAQANINIQPGAFQKQWEQAFNDYAATFPGHWHQAARELDALATSYPSFKGIQPYKDYADQTAAVEQLPADNSSLILIASAVAAVLLILAIVLSLILLSRRRKARRALAAAYASQNQPYGAYGPPSPYGGYAPSQYGTYGPPSTYGGYAPPSRYGNYSPSTPYGSAATPPAPTLSAPTYEPARPASSVATSVRDLAPDGSAPMGRMPFPSPARSNSGASNPERGEPAPDNAGSGSRPNLPLHVPATPPPSPAPFASYGWPASSSAVGPGRCTNGHPMPAGELYCAMCGAARIPTPS